MSKPEKPKEFDPEETSRSQNNDEELDNLAQFLPKASKDAKEIAKEIAMIMGGAGSFSSQDDNEDEDLEDVLSDVIGPKVKFNSRDEWLDYWAELCANYHRLDIEKVKTVYRRCDEIGWLVPNPPSMTGLDFAMIHMEPQKALELFEKTEDLKDLRYRDYTFRYLTGFMFEPYCTLSEFAKLLGKLKAFQMKYEEQIIKTGFPNRIFQKPDLSDKNMWWFEWHLGRLYYLKSPVNTQSIYFTSDKPDAFYRNNLELWKGDKTEYYSIWAKETVEIIVSDLKKTTILHEPTSEILLRLCKIENSKFVNCDGNVVGESCSYSEAPCFDFIKPEMESRLEELREKVFYMRLEIISRLQMALELESADNLRDDCLDIMQILSFDEVQFLLKTDRLFMNPVNETKVGHPYNILCDENRNAGLSDIFHVIGYIEKELTLKTIHQTKKLLDGIVRKQNYESYFQVANTKWQKKVDKALEWFISSREKEMDFNTGFHRRVNEELDRNRKNQYRYENLISEMESSVLSHKSLTGNLPDYDPNRLVSSIFEKGIDDNVFRRLGDKWIIRFNGVLIGLFNNSIGIHHIAMLLSKPNRTIHSSKLIALYYTPNSYQNIDQNEEEGTCLNNDDSYSTKDYEPLEDSPSIKRGKTIPVDQILSQECIQNFHNRLEEIKSEILNAESKGNLAKLEKLNDEKDWLKSELSKNTGIFGKSRDFVTNTERDRKAVSKAIHDVMEKIEERNASFGKYLNEHLDIGIFCIYKTSEQIPWQL